MDGQPTGPDPGPSGTAVVVRGSAWLVSSIALQGLSGYVFWLAAARLYDSDQVGHALALWGSAQFVSYLTSLGLTVTVARWCGKRSRAEVVFTWSVLATAVATAIGTLGYLALVTAESFDVIRQWGTPAAAGMFFFVVLGTSLAALVDIRLAADRLFGWILWRVIALSVLRLALLPLFRTSGAADIWLFLLGGGAAALSGLVVTALLPTASGARWRLRPLPAERVEIVRFSAVNYLADLAARAPLFALPVVVLTSVGATENANFFVAFQITVLVFLVPMTVGQVVLIEGGRSVQHAAAQARLALVATLGLMAAAAAVTWALSGVLVPLYGSEYEQAADLLPLLMLAGIPWAVTSITLAELRVRGSHLGTAAVTVTFAVGVLLPALVLVPDDGADGAVVAWLIGNVAAAVVGAVAAAVTRRERSGAIWMDSVGPIRKDLRRAAVTKAE